MKLLLGASKIAAALSGSTITKLYKPDVPPLGFLIDTFVWNQSPNGTMTYSTSGWTLADVNTLEARTFVSGTNAAATGFRFRLYDSTAPQDTHLSFAEQFLGYVEVEPTDAAWENLQTSAASTQVDIYLTPSGGSEYKLNVEPLQVGTAAYSSSFPTGTSGFQFASAAGELYFFVDPANMTSEALSDLVNMTQDNSYNGYDIRFESTVGENPFGVNMLWDDWTSTEISNAGLDVPVLNSTAPYNTSQGSEGYLEPMARWITPLGETVEGSTFTVGIVATNSDYGVAEDQRITKVEFYLDGQALGTPSATVTSRTMVDMDELGEVVSGSGNYLQVPVFQWTIDTSSWSPGDEHRIRAIVYPKNGKPLILQGDPNSEFRVAPRQDYVNWASARNVGNPGSIAPDVRRIWSGYHDLFLYKAHPPIQTTAANLATSVSAYPYRGKIFELTDTGSVIWPQDWWQGITPSGMRHGFITIRGQQANRGLTVDGHDSVPAANQIPLKLENLTLGPKLQIGSGKRCFFKDITADRGMKPAVITGNPMDGVTDAATAAANTAALPNATTVFNYYKAALGNPADQTVYDTFYPLIQIGSSNYWKDKKNRIIVDLSTVPSEDQNRTYFIANGNGVGTMFVNCTIKNFMSTVKNTSLVVNTSLEHAWKDTTGGTSASIGVGHFQCCQGYDAANNTHYHNDFLQHQAYTTFNMFAYGHVGFQRLTGEYNAVSNDLFANEGQIFDFRGSTVCGEAGMKNAAIVNTAWIMHVPDDGSSTGNCNVAHWNCIWENNLWVQHSHTKQGVPNTPSPVLRFIQQDFVAKNQGAFNANPFDSYRSTALLGSLNSTFAANEGASHPWKLFDDSNTMMKVDPNQAFNAGTAPATPAGLDPAVASPVGWEPWPVNSNKPTVAGSFNHVISNCVISGIQAIAETPTAHVLGTEYTYNGTTTTWQNWITDVNRANEGWLAYVDATDTVFNGVYVCDDVPAFSASAEWLLDVLPGVSAGEVPTRANTPMAQYLPGRIAADTAWWSNYTGVSVTHPVV